MWTLRLSDVGLLLFVLLALPVGRAWANPALPPDAQEDPLSAYRERFKLGMDRYRAGQVAEAIGYWEPVYRELGEETGYRLAYDLALAYSELGDATHAAERLQAFVREVDARRARGETLGALIDREASDARERMTALIASRGRIRIDAAVPPAAAQVDAGEPRIGGFVAWVTPGEHSVVFSPGTAGSETRRVSVAAGELVELAPPAPPTKPETESPPATEASAVAANPAPAPHLANPVLSQEPTRPFSPVVIAAGAGLTVAVAIGAVLWESHATALRDRLVAEQAQSVDRTITPSDRQSFYEARTLAYAATATAIGLGAVTAGLTTWYVWGRSVRPTVGLQRGGARLGFETRF
jgi:hypothetical protein